MGACAIILLSWCGVVALRNGGHPGDARVNALVGGGKTEFPVPVPERAQRYVLTVAVGQQGGRRVCRLRLAGTDIYLGSGEVRARLA